MKITESKQGPWSVLTLTGKIDPAGAGALEAFSLHAENPPRRRQ